MRLSAFDCLGRGWASVVANWELVPIECLRVIVVTVGTLAGIIPVVGLLDPGFAIFSPASLLAPAAWGERIANVVQLHPARLIFLLIIWLLVSMATFLFSCFLRGGTFGVLVGADRQAPPGGGRGSAWFRTFSARDFRGWGGRMWGRYFWLANLDVVVLIVLLGLAGAMAIALEWAFESGRVGLASGFGCAAIPIVLVIVIASRVWVAVARADAGREEATVGGAAIRALALLGNRMGALALLVIVLAAIGFAAWICFFAANVFLGRLFGGDLLAQAVATLAQGVVEIAAFALLALWFNGSLVALVRSEVARGKER